MRSVLVFSLKEISSDSRLNLHVASLSGVPNIQIWVVAPSSSIILNKKKIFFSPVYFLINPANFVIGTIMFPLAVILTFFQLFVKLIALPKFSFLLCSSDSFTFSIVAFLFAHARRAKIIFDIPPPRFINSKARVQRARHFLENATASLPEYRIVSTNAHRFILSVQKLQSFVVKDCPSSYFHPVDHPPGKKIFLGSGAQIKLPAEFEVAKRSSLPYCELAIIPKGSAALGISMEVYEAVACGVPVYSLRRGCVNEIVVEGISGRLFDSIDELMKAFNSEGIHCISREKCRDALPIWDLEWKKAFYSILEIKS